MREHDKPSSLLFEELGYDRDPDTGESKEKHYRAFYP